MLMIRVFLALALAMATMAPNARADEGFLSSWNPFSSTKQQARPASSKTGTGLLNKFSLPSFQRKPNQPTPLQRINQGAKNLLTKTKDVLTPWDNKPAPRNSSSSKGWGWFNWGRQPQEPEINTVNDFLKLPTPR